MDNNTEEKSLNKVRRISLIQKYIDPEIYLELFKTQIITGIDNNEKSQLMKAKLKEMGVPYNPLGPGTNRLGVQIDGYAFKIALDKDGMIDNRREYKYSRPIQPHVVKVYESIPNGMIASSEYISIFSYEEFKSCKNEIKEILEEISSQGYLIGDVGFSERNYINWGRRADGSICIMDFAYIYDVKYNTFQCNCGSTSMLRYDSNYVNLICPHCGRKYEFGEIRRRISRKTQEEEIGDIRSLGYNLTQYEEEVEYNQEFEPKKIIKEKKPSKKDFIKKLKEEQQERKRISEDYWNNYIV